MLDTIKFNQLDVKKFKINDCKKKREGEFIYTKKNNSAQYDQ